MFEIVLLSFMQSLTEFLPVSSSGHLVLLKAFGLSQQTLFMDVVLHLGTLLAILFYFRRDIKHLLMQSWHRGAEQALTLKLIIATFPICLVGFLLIKHIESLFHTPKIIALTSIVFGLFLWLSDSLRKKNNSLNKLTYKGAFIIGCFQVLSLIPGTSRSGITITAARLLGLNRVDSTKFSMLLSIPTIAASGLFALWQTTKTPFTDPIFPFILGCFLSALFGLFAISFLMKWVKKSSFVLFAIYRLILGILLLILF